MREKAVVEGVIRDTAFAEEEVLAETDEKDKEEYSYCPYCGKRLP